MPDTLVQPKGLQLTLDGDLEDLLATVNLDVSGLQTRLEDAFRGKDMEGFRLRSRDYLFIFNHMILLGRFASIAEADQKTLIDLILDNMQRTGATNLNLKVLWDGSGIGTWRIISITKSERTLEFELLP